MATQTPPPGYSGSAGEQSTTGQITDQVGNAAGQAAEQAKEQVGQARERVRDQVDQRSTQAGEQVSTQAQDLRSVAQALRQEGKDQPAQLAEQVADRAERLGGYLKDADPDRLLHDLEDYARRQPLAVGLAAAALGFAGARFLKASSADRYERRSTGSTPASRPALPARTATPRTDAGTYAAPSPVTPPATPGTTPSGF